jgi:alpha-tubulin suppressor-like RCC1 family protein
MKPGVEGPLSADGRAILDALKDNENLKFIVGGHITGEGYATFEHKGRLIHTFVMDFQGDENGGNGSGNSGLAADGSVIQTVELGNRFSLALTRDGKVYATGDNSLGQLTGTGNKTTFTEVTGLGGKTIIAIAAGGYHSLAVDSLGKVYGTGFNSDGQIAYPASPLEVRSVSTFSQVTGLENKRIIAVAAGNYNSLALTSDGDLYAAGLNTDNYRDFSEDPNAEGNDFLTTFTKVRGFEDKKIIAISAKSSRIVLLTSQGEVYLAGEHIVAREGEDPATLFTKALGLEGKPIAAISVHYTHTLALSRSGHVYGSGLYSTIGAGIAGDGGTGYAEFIPVVFSNDKPANEKITAIAAGHQFSLALTDTGKVYGAGWGSGYSFAKPDNAPLQRFYPSTGLDNQIITAIAAGYECSLAMNSLGQVYATGKNDSGQLTGEVFLGPRPSWYSDLRIRNTFTLATGL